MIAHLLFAGRRVIVKTHQVQRAMDDQTLQLLAQRNRILLGILPGDRHAYGNGGDSPARRCCAEIECDHISRRIVVQKIPVQRSNGILVHPIHIDMNGSGAEIIP